MTFVSTICAINKHKLSLDRPLPRWQLPPMSIGARIAGARTAAKWSQARLADKVGTAQTTVSSWERGRTEPTREDVQRIADALGLELAELELGESSDSVGQFVNVVGWVGAGDAAHFYDASQGPFDQVKAPEDSTENTVAAVVKGASIGRHFDGWYVFYDERREPVTADQIGRLCVVGLPDGRTLLKWLKPSRTPGIYHLESETEPAMSDQEVAWAARVTNMRPD